MQKTIVKKHDFIKRLLLIGIGIFYCSFSVSADNTDILPAKVVDDWFVELSNWGRWGKDDQKGTLNLITPETRIAAAKLVTKGISLSLAHNALMEKTIDNRARGNVPD